MQWWMWPIAVVGTLALVFVWSVLKAEHDERQGRYWFDD